MNLILASPIARCALAVLVLHASASLSEDGPALAPARETQVTIPRNGGSMLVYLPTNYSAERQWPAIFYYHGTSGQPTTALIRRHADGRDYIVVGMPYIVRSNPKRTEEEQEQYIQAELTNLRTAREWLRANAHIDEGRVFLAGLSKGGWTSSILGNRDMPRLAGLVILLAARQRTAMDRPSDSLRGKPVYIGVGETDANILPALQSRIVYSRYGASVTYEEFAGLGHQAPHLAPRLAAWLEANGPYSHPWADAAGIAALKDRFHAAYKEILASADAPAKYTALLDLADDPRLRLCGDNVVRGVLAQAEGLARQSPARELRQAELSFNKLAWLEWNIKYVKDITRVREGFFALSRAHPSTPFGRRAAEFHERVVKIYGQAEKQAQRDIAAMEAEAKKTKPRRVNVSFPNAKIE